MKDREKISNLIAKCRIMEHDHYPYGWPAIQMIDVTMLCDEIERLTPRFEIGERVTVLMFSGEVTGVVVSRSEHKNISPQYGVFAQYQDAKEARWHPEDCLVSASNEEVRE